MFFPRLMGRCPRRNVDRQSDKSALRLLAIGLLCLLGAGAAVAQTPGVDLRKDAGDVVDNGDGSYSVPITLTVTNTGDEVLTSLQVEDYLNIFGRAHDVVVENLNTPGLTANNNYDGLFDLRLLTGTDSLPVAATRTLTFDIRFDPGPEAGPFLNTAIVSGIGKDSGDLVEDSANEFILLIPPPILVPAVEIQKDAGTVVDNDDGTLSVPIAITATNTGNEPLASLQIEDFLGIFGNGMLVAVENLQSPTLSVNPDYDGETDINLLSGTDSLAENAAATVTFTLRFDPGQELGPFVNIAIATAFGEISGNTTGHYDDASFPGIPTQQQASIDIRKDAGTVVDNGDGTLSVPFTITVTNSGSEALRSLQIEDELEIFGNGVLVAIENLQSVTLSVNPNYDGLTDTGLLTGSDSLPLLGIAAVRFSLRFDPGPEPGPFVNTAITTAIGDTSGAPTSASDDAEVSRLAPPAVNPGGIAVTKTAGRSEVMRGESIAYELSITNLTASTVSDIAVTDDPPIGFMFVNDSAMLIRAGLDGLLNTADDEVRPIASSGNDPIEFDSLYLGPDESVLIRYLMRVSVGVSDGEYVNGVTVTPFQKEPASSVAPVMVMPDPVFEKTTLIGKVFDDKNGNGVQEEERGERGIPGARLATVGGLIIETDAEGRYHIADTDVESFARGANFVLKLDVASLPTGTVETSANPRIIRLTQATMSKINFAVKLPEQNLDLARASPPSPNDESDIRCNNEKQLTANNAVAAEITVSGGLFGRGRLVAKTLPGRTACGRSEVTVFAGLAEAATNVVALTDCLNLLPSDELASTVELRTKNGTVLCVTTAGDVIRVGDPDNNEHIIVTPFRDETDSVVVSALRIVNDGVDPGAVPARSETGLALGARSSPGIVDQLFADPRLEVLAMNRAVLNARGRLDTPVQFAIYTNYPAFIERYKLEVYGRMTGSADESLLYKKKFSNYRFDERHVFDGGDKYLARFAELEYVLTASNCLTPTEEKDCTVDITDRRILKLHRVNENPEIHSNNKLWGQSSLAEQRIPIRGGRTRQSGTIETRTPFLEIGGRYVPVTDDGRYIFEEIVPLGSPDPMPITANSVSKPDIISADARDIRISGGLFGCDKSVVGLLPGRPGRNSTEPVQTITAIADPALGIQAFSICSDKQRSPHCLSGIEKLPPGEIEISTAAGSCFRVTSAGDVLPLKHPPAECNGPENNCSREQLVVTPFRDDTDSSIISAMRISNEGFDEELPRDGSGTIVTEPAVNHAFFAVALANLTIGQNNVSGNSLPLAADSHFDGSTYTDGRLAMYAKGKLKDRFLITAQIDTTEDELSKLGDNLKRKDPRAIFRQLDPNRYYPVYGDDSVTNTDVDTQGALFARVEWDRNSAMWGNFNTALTDTEFTQYNRSLYGAVFSHESTGTTEFGQSRTRLTAFGSEAQSAAAHVAFRATGGSLYYLRDTDIVQGSEKVWVEVRRRDTEQVVERAVLIEGRDYEIDAIQGRIILRRPLSQVVNDRQRSIIRSTPLEGDEVYLLVDYEYVPDTFNADNLTYGGRGQIWLTDRMAIGATSVADERDGTDYSLQGADLTLQGTENTYIRAEFAQSRARQNDANFISDDGGLSFQSQAGGGTGDSLDGDATAIELQLDFAELTEKMERKLDGDLHAWWKSRGADFSAGRLAQGVAVNDSGIELDVKIGDRFAVQASHTDLERELTSRERVTRMQVDGTFGDFVAGIEARHEDVEYQGLIGPVSDLNGRAGDGEALLLGARVAYTLSDETSVYATGQTVADDKGLYEQNDLFAVGINTELSEQLGVSFEASDGDRGSALIAGMDYALKDGLNFEVSGGVGSGAISQFATRYAIGEGHELYGSYAVDPDRTDAARNLLTLGQRRSYGNGIGIWTESQFGKDDRYASVGHVFGLDFDGDDDWRFSASMQASENEGLGLAFDRTALSFGVYRNSGDLKLSSRIEYREDEGPGVHSRQYLSSNSVTRIVNENRRWLGQLNISWTDDELNGGREARFVEFDVGYAIRPAGNDRLNLISRYSFLYDLPTRGQATIRPDERSHLFSIEGIYDPDNRWEYAVKAAIRDGDTRSMRNSGPWEDFGLQMISTRARYQVNEKWDGVAEYRWLANVDDDSERHGALLAMYRQLNKHLKVGVGFNFTDFNDELRIDNYDSNGWFVDIVGTY